MVLDDPKYEYGGSIVKKAVRVCAEVNTTDGLIKSCHLRSGFSAGKLYVSLHMPRKEKLDLEGFESF